MAKIWFGNLIKGAYVEAPVSGMDAGLIGSSEQMTFLNGGAYTALSGATHREFNMTWAPTPKVNIDFLSMYRNSEYGEHLLYWVDPFALNALPPHWASPHLSTKDWPSLHSANNEPVAVPSGLVTNLATNPRFESASSTTVDSSEGTRPVPTTGVNNGDAMLWRSSVRAKSGTYSAAFEWVDTTVVGSAEPYPDTFYPDELYPA